jgi:tetratricopeptide (TPR) repeat protein
MASKRRKRLNKKVALTGSVVFLIVVFVIVAAILYWSRDPEKFIEDGNAALKVKDYEAAERYYRKAYSLAKPGSQRVDILFKLADIYMKNDQWPKVRGCWEQIINIDTENVRARLGRLRYIYIVGDTYVNSGRHISTIWQDIHTQAAELLDIVEKADLLDEEREKWEPSFGLQETESQRDDGQRLGPYLFLIRGRAAYELARMGAVTLPGEWLTKATEDLEKVLELDPANVDAYIYLAATIVEEGELLALRGSVEERERAASGASELLEKAVEAAGSEPRSHINLLSRKLSLARSGDPTQTRENVAALEPEYLALVNRFNSSAKAFAALSGFYSIYSVYSGPQRGLENLNKAIEAIERAVELAPEDVGYAINAAKLVYQRFSVYGQKPAIQKAIDIARKALDHRDVQDTAGPRSYANMINRFTLYSFLAHCYIEQIVDPKELKTDSEISALLKDAEQSVHEIEQIFGSGEDPQVIKWQGMLELARGNKNEAVRKLYTAYEDLKASKPTDSAWPADLQFAQLSYALARVFEDTPEVGAVREFLINAIRSGIELVRPDAILDYLELLGRLDQWQHVLSPINHYNINAFEQTFGASQRSREIRIRAMIGTNAISEAEEELAKLNQNEPHTIKLKIDLVQAKIIQIRRAIAQRRAQSDTSAILEMMQPDQQEETQPDASIKLMTTELDGLSQLRVELVEKLLLEWPSFVERNVVSAVCRDYIAKGHLEEARSLVSAFLATSPDDPEVLFYKELLSEPDPQNVSQQRRRQIEQQAILSISDPIRRALELGLFYHRNDESAKAIEQFSKVVKDLEERLTEGDISEKLSLEQMEEKDSYYVAANYLLNLACKDEDWSIADYVVDVARRANLEGCQGQLFSARLAMAKNQLEDALAKVNDCLRQKSIFSRVYLFRSNIHAALDNEHASFEDIRKAVSLNPVDGVIAKSFANILYLRNQRLGSNVSPSQIEETKLALERAVRLNLGDLELLDVYAGYISTLEPLKALAIRQSMQKTSPTVLNAVLIANLATQEALKETDPSHKKALFDLAETSLEWAKNRDATNTAMLQSYAEFYRATGQNKKAGELLSKSQDQRLLWRHYFQLGRFDDARNVLEQLYRQNDKDTDVLKGLMLVAERTVDKQAVKRYSEKLLSVEDTAINRVGQVTAFLRVGLVKEAELKLQSLQEKYPDEPRAFLLEGWVAMRQGQLEKALEITNRNLESNQDNSAAWRLRGEINLLMANYDQAIFDLNRSKLLSSIPATRMLLARAYMRAGRYDEAVTELKNTIDEPAAPVEARVLLEQVYFTLDRKDDLKRLYDDTLEKFPDSVTWHNRAASFAVSQKDYDRAERLYRKAYQLKLKQYQGQDEQTWSQDAQYAKAFDGYLQSLVLGAGTPDGKSGPWHPQKLDKVFEEAKEYIDTVFAPVAYYRMAEAKFKLGDKQAAIERCRKAVDKAEANEKLAAEILLRMYLLIGDVEVARYCQEKLETNPDSLVANYTMFNLAKIKDEYDKAVSYADKCIELTVSDDQRAAKYVLQKTQMLSEAYEETSDNTYLEKAIIDYESLLQKMPNNTSVLNNLAYMLAENGKRLARALECSKRALELMPNNPNFLDTYAYVLHRNGRNPEAAEFLAAALQQYQQQDVSVPPEVYLHLGMVKEELGDKPQALDAYMQALQVGADRLSDAVKKRIESAIKRLSL